MFSNVLLEVFMIHRDKHAYLFNYTDIGNTVFFNRQDALEKVNLAEKDKIEVSDETYYEED